MRAIITVFSGLFTWFVIVLIQLAKNRNMRKDASDALQRAVQRTPALRIYLPENYIDADDHYKKLKVSDAIIENSMHPLFIVVLISTLDLVYSLVIQQISGSLSLVTFIFYMVTVILFMLGHELWWSRSDNSKTWWYAMIVGGLWLGCFIFLSILMD